jgi:hypothetical protein
MPALRMRSTAKRPCAGQCRRDEKKVFVSFEEDLVRGSMTGAELFLILQKKQTKFEHLFDVKEDFTEEMTNAVRKQSRRPEYRH